MTANTPACISCEAPAVSTREVPLCEHHARIGDTFANLFASWPAPDVERCGESGDDGAAYCDRPVEYGECPVHGEVGPPCTA